MSELFLPVQFVHTRAFEWVCVVPVPAGVCLAGWIPPRSPRHSCQEALMSCIMAAHRDEGMRVWVRNQIPAYPRVKVNVENPTAVLSALPPPVPLLSS